MVTGYETVDAVIPPEPIRSMTKLNVLAYEAGGVPANAIDVALTDVI
jgi:hypothetical protein